MSLHIITIHNLIICVNVSNLDVFTSKNWHIFIDFNCNFCAFEPNCYVYKSYIVYFIKLIYSCVAIYMGLYCIWQSCLSSCRTLWVCFSLGFRWCFFFPRYSASLQAGFSAFKMSPLFTLRSSWIKYNNCWKLNEPADLEYKSNQQQKATTTGFKQFEYFYWADFYRAAIFFNNISYAYFVFIMFLLSFQKRNLPYGRWSGFLGDHKTALLSLRRACCICGACDCI